MINYRTISLTLSIIFREINVHTFKILRRQHQEIKKKKKVKNERN